MRLLLDTHALIWWATADARLSRRARDLIQDPGNEIVVSAISVLEITIKAGRGSLTVGGSARQFVDDEVLASGFHPLPLTFDHAVRVYNLPPIHRDPFDRVLVAQADVEAIPIVTDDQQIRRYSIRVEW
jgi:PIN domain nuclease of toxin-antitoxin system